MRDFIENFLLATLLVLILFVGVTLQLIFLY